MTWKYNFDFTADVTEDTFVRTGSVEYRALRTRGCVINGTEVHGMPTGLAESQQKADKVRADVEKYFGIKV